MDFAFLPPEINSGRMYDGPGAGSMLAAAAAWDGLAAELHSTATSYGSVISELSAGPWLGAASAAMTAASRTLCGLDEFHRHAGRTDSHPSQSGGAPPMR